MMDIVIDYATRGYKILPCGRDKRPLNLNRFGHGYKDATCDFDILQSAWKKHPDALIGLATGSDNGILVLDFDTHKNAKCLDDFEREFGIKASEHPYRVRTMRGGLHLYYRVSGEVPCRNGFREGVDIKGDGGYVIAPDGKRYILEGAGVAPEKLKELPDLPTAILDKLVLPSKQVAFAFDRTTMSDKRRYQSKECLKFINPEEYDTWIKVGMALHLEFGGDKEGLELWMNWASSSDKFKSEDHPRRWKGFDASKTNTVGLGTLRHMRNEAIYESQ